MLLFGFGACYQGHAIRFIATGPGLNIARRRQAGRGVKREIPLSLVSWFLFED